MTKTIIAVLLLLGLAGQAEAKAKGKSRLKLAQEANSIALNRLMKVETWKRDCNINAFNKSNYAWKLNFDNKICWKAPAVRFSDKDPKVKIYCPAQVADALNERRQEMLQACRDSYDGIIKQAEARFMITQEEQIKAYEEEQRAKESEPIVSGTPP